MLASVSELGFLSSTQVWSYHSHTSGPTLTISATNLPQLRSYLTNSRVGSMHFALWLEAVSIFDQLSSTDHGTGSTWALCGSRGAAAVGRIGLWGLTLLWAAFDGAPQPLPLGAPIASHPCLLVGYLGCDPESLCLLSPVVCGGMYGSALDP